MGWGFQKVTFRALLVLKGIAGQVRFNQIGAERRFFYLIEAKNAGGTSVLNKFFDKNRGSLAIFNIKIPMLGFSLSVRVTTFGLWHK